MRIGAGTKASFDLGAMTPPPNFFLNISIYSGTNFSNFVL